MRRIVLLIAICCQVFMVAAQKKAPKWMDKQRKAVVSVTTYGKDGQKAHTGTGFFIHENGEALSAYSLFKDAARAIVTDMDGKEYPVAAIVGADELYDVIKFKVDVPKKVAYFPIASDPVSLGSTAYLLPYAPGKQLKFEEGPIVEVSKLKDPYSYYKMSIALEAGQVNSPLLTENGEVFGLAQEDASGKKENSYAVSAGYANSLQVNSADAFNTVYSRMGIKKAWPADVDQAQVSLFLLASTQDAKAYLETLNDFIATFPNSADGYLSRANHYAYRRADLAATADQQVELLNKALEDIYTASRFSDRKGDVWFNQAKLIYGVAAVDTTLTDPKWTIDAATEAIQKAIQAEDLPIYHQMEGDINLYKGNFEQAYADYMKVNQSDMASSTSWYWAAKAMANIRGANFGDIIALLDSAITKSGITPTREVAPYILERVDLRLKLMQYEEAVKDYDLYYTVMNGQVGDGFFYYREQAKFRMNDFAGALTDIQEAIKLSPDDPAYYAEEASVYLRLEKYDEALKSIDNALRIAPDFAACYRLRGICYVRQNKKAEACVAFQKSKELGDPVVDKLIKEHCK